jgi:hypothetical protein
MLENAFHLFLRGAHAPSRADFGAVAEILSDSKQVREREGAIAST